MVILIAVDILTVMALYTLAKKSTDLKEQALKKIDDVCNWWLGRRATEKEEDE